MRVDLKEPILMANLLKSYSQGISSNQLNGFTIDSRKVKEGDIYLPIVGEHFDGHDFIEDALQSGASLVFSENKSNTSNPKITYVNSTLGTLSELATEYRKHINGKVIGITGTNGKTTNKDLLYHVVSPSFTTMKTEGNFNSTIGLPITMFSIPIDIEYCILEMGASEPGEIQTLCEIAQPNMGLITNVSEAHISQFKTIEEIAETKSALFTSLPFEGIAFINNDDEYVSNIDIKSKGVTFGFKNKSDFNAEINQNKNALIINGKSIYLENIDFTFAKNALAVYSIASTLGLSHEEIVSQFQSFVLPKGRGGIHKINDITFIDDSYNANLKSAIAGLETLIQCNCDGKRIAVLGDMLELGVLENKHHKLLGEYISNTNIDVVFTFGQLTKNTFNSINNSKIITNHFTEKTQLINELQSVANTGDVIYLKGSRGMQMEEVIKQGFNHHVV